MGNVIETASVSKTYRTGLGRPGVVALSDVSMSVDEGEVFAMLGLNGAGKSTLTGILLGLVRPSTGKVLLFGGATGRGSSKQKIGYLPELFSAPGLMTPRQVLRFMGELDGLTRDDLKRAVRTQLVNLNLEEVADRRVRTLSKGTVLRLGIAQALLTRPRLLVLDEPTEGLDPAGRVLIRNLIIELARSGVTILLNSHLLSEVEMVAHRIGILHRGRLVVSGRLAELLPHNQQFLVELSSEPPAAVPWQFSQSSNGWTSLVDGAENLQQLLSALHSHSISPLSVRPLNTTLEEAFFHHISDDHRHERGSH